MLLGHSWILRELFLSFNLVSFWHLNCNLLIPRWGCLSVIRTLWCDTLLSLLSIIVRRNDIQWWNTCHLQWLTVQILYLLNNLMDLISINFNSIIKNKFIYEIWNYLLFERGFPITDRSLSFKLTWSFTTSLSSLIML